MPTRFPIAVICAATLVHSVYAADGTPDNSHALPSRQQVVAFLIETIDWYRHLSAVQQTVAEPADILFLEDSRAVGTQVVRFSFDFAKALEAFEATLSVPTDPGSGRKAPLSPDFQHLQAMETQSETETQQAAADLNTLKTKRIAAWGPDRKQLDAEIADTQSRLELLRAISASFQNLLDFAEAANAGPTQAADQRASGILGLISGVSSFARRRRAIYEAIQRTDNLLRCARSLGLLCKLLPCNPEGRNSA